MKLKHTNKKQTGGLSYTFLSMETTLTYVKPQKQIDECDMTWCYFMGLHTGPNQCNWQPEDYIDNSATLLLLSSMLYFTCKLILCCRSCFLLFDRSIIYPSVNTMKFLHHSFNSAWFAAFFMFASDKLVLPLSADNDFQGHNSWNTTWWIMSVM